MYFSSELEFIPAFYHAYYSTYDVETKERLLDEIYQEYMNSDFTDTEVDQVFYELKSGNYKEDIDLEFLDFYKGRVFSIDQLLKKKIKIHYLEKSNYLEKILTIDKSKCLMCSSKNLYTYTGSFDTITYCQECIDFGASKSNEVRFLIRNYSNQVCKFTKPKVTLSEQQKEASDFLLENSSNNKSSLIWAVCGAGKTEIIYELISTYLSENKNICLAIPRKDVVKELAIRIENDFDLKINSLHGDEKKLLGKNIYIMTCHQLFYYYDFFDLVIVDEVDAFPYNGDKVLEYGLKKSLKNNSPLVFLSATPSEKIKNSVDEIFKLPIRYHKNLLPLPKIKIKKDLEDKLICGSVLKDIEEFIENSKSKNRRVLIFAPTIKIGEALSLATSYNFVSSQTENRQQLVESFRNREFDIMISTTILERGVTLDYLDVFVFYANHETFSKEALIQISGRVGRKDYDPMGEICFYASHKSKTMKLAIKEIDYMNELAKLRKLVKSNEM